MFFEFIKYTQPGWQFNILPVTNSFPSCFVNEKDCPHDLIDVRYQTRSAQLLDAGFSLVNKGVLLESTQNDIEELKKMTPPNLFDEYFFVRKYWGTGWASFTFIRRIFSFKNPFKEIRSYLKTRDIKKVNPFQPLGLCRDYDNFQSSLLDSKPLVAVIIPTLNRYEYLKDVLFDLEKQTHANFEVIIVDQSDNFDENFYKNFELRLKIIPQKEKKLWTARNSAVKATDAEYLLFFDDDSRVEKDWIAEHLKCVDYFNVSISAGVSIAVIGQKISESYSYFRWATQFDSGNALVKRNVFKDIGLFDEQYNGMRMGDAEFGFRAYKNGLKSISNHKASRVHLKVSSGGLREMGSWDGFRPKKWFAPKPVPSVIYLFEKYLSKELCRNSILLGIFLSNISYKNKRSSKMLALSLVFTVIKSPVLLIQYSKAKKIALKMQANDEGPSFLQK
jgi:GT2 family glycosyltransferase